VHTDDRLRVDGAIVIRELLDQAWCERLHEAIDRCRRSPGPHYAVLSPPDAPRVDSDLFRWSDDPDIAALVDDSPLVDAALDLLDSDAVVLVEDQWFASSPGSSTPSPWHQDQPYYRLDREFLTIWITLDDIEQDCALRVVPGSHATGITYAPVEFSATTTTIEDGSGLAPVPEIDDHPDAYPVTTWSLRAGDAIALDSRTLHATGRGSPVAEFRRISTRWAAPDTRYRAAVPGAASFWDVLPHGLTDGDPIASPTFPLRSRR
jgi:hypothetical protein